MIADVVYSVIVADSLPVIPIVIIGVLVLLIVLILSIVIVKRNQKSVTIAVDNTFKTSSELKPLNNNVATVNTQQPIVDISNNVDVISNTTEKVEVQETINTKEPVNVAENNVNVEKENEVDFNLINDTSNFVVETEEVKDIKEMDTDGIKITDDEGNILNHIEQDKSDTAIDIEEPEVDNEDATTVIIPVSEKLNENMEESPEIPDFVDPRTIKENGEDVVIHEGVKLEEKGESALGDEEPININLKGIGEEVDVVPPVVTHVVSTETVTNVSPFKMTPSDNRDINTDVKVEPPKEYVGIKTEILDLNDIKELLEKTETNKSNVSILSDEEILKKIEEIQDDVIDEANKMIADMKVQ